MTAAAARPWPPLATYIMSEALFAMTLRCAASRMPGSSAALDALHAHNAAQEADEALRDIWQRQFRNTVTGE